MDLILKQHKQGARKNIERINIPFMYVTHLPIQVAYDNNINKENMLR